MVNTRYTIHTRHTRSLARTHTLAHLTAGLCYEGDLISQEDIGGNDDGGNGGNSIRICEMKSFNLKVQWGWHVHNNMYIAWFISILVVSENDLN